MLRCTALLLLAAAPAAAQSIACRDATTQTALNVCAGIALHKADAVLNEWYREVMLRLSPASQQRLRDAERAWIAWRDSECAFRSSGADGGSAAPMIAAQCRTELTDARARELDKLRTCAEGDLSCPR